MATQHVFTKGNIYTDNSFAVKVINRKGDFITFKNLANDQTFRRKVKVTYVRGESYEVIDIREDWDKGFPIAFHVLASGILPEFSQQVISRAKEWYKMLYADDDKQQEENATDEITTSATDNSTATASQPAIVETPHSKTAKFITGNLYYIDVDAKRSVKIIARTEKTVTFWNDIEKKETRAKIHTDSCGEFFFPYSRYSCAPEIHAFRNQEYVDNYKREAEIATSQPVVVYSPAIDEAEYTVTYDCTAPSQPEQPAIVETVQSQTNSQPEIVKFEVGKTYQNDSPDFCYGAYYTITGKSRQFVSFESYFLRKQAYKKLRIGTDRNGVLCEYFDDKEKGSPYPAQMVFATALAPDIPNNEDTPVTAATTQTESAPAIIYGMCDVEKALRRIKSKSNHTPADFTQPDALYIDDSFSDATGDNSCPEQDIPECLEADSILADNPGFTVVPSEHITRPDYTVYPDTIIDKCPYTTVYACDFPTHSPTAVIPYAEAAPIRKIYRIISIFIRLWIGLHSHARSDVIRSHVFAPWFIELADYAPGNPNDISPLIYKWQRKKFSEKLKLCRSQIATCKTREQIIACLQNVSSESIRLLCVADRVFSKTTRIAAPECERKLAYAQFYADKIIQRREKSTPVHAEINDFTPKPEPQPKTKPRKLEAANDSEHKLIETKDLHFQERRNALDHNAAVISSCLFHEAIVSMLLKISPAAIIQLGFHMGLFIAKPKGKKIVIAEAFAKRLIEHRDLRAKTSASVHTNTAQHTSINTASIPDNVKLFETKHRQLAFMFTDELMFTE